MPSEIAGQYHLQKQFLEIVHRLAHDTPCGCTSILAYITPDMCPAHTGEVGKLQGEFAKRGVKLLALSCNDVDSHKGCVQCLDGRMQCLVTMHSVFSLQK